MTPRASAASDSSGGVAALGALGGAAHLGATWLLLPLFGLTPGTGAVFFYTVVGAFLLGAVPALLFAAGRLVAPALVVGAAFVVSAAATYATYVAPAVAATPVDPTPFGWYLLGWVAVAGGALAAGVAEVALRRRRAAPGLRSA